MVKAAKRTRFVALISIMTLAGVVGASRSPASAAGSCSLSIISMEGVPGGANTQCQCATGYASSGYDVYTCSGGGQNYQCTYWGASGLGSARRCLAAQKRIKADASRLAEEGPHPVGAEARCPQRRHRRCRSSPEVM
jgi:hypothetical protein